MSKLVFIDLETTGLVPSECEILELGIVITDADLKMVGAFQSVICPRFFDQAKLDPFILKMHTKNGLLAEVRSLGRQPDAVEMSSIQWLDTHFEHLPLDRITERPAMCGSSVQFDRSFIEHHMPLLFDRFSYRNIDVSTIKELARLWSPDVVNSLPIPKKAHRVFSDLEDTIEELEHYKKAGFLTKSQGVNVR